MRGYFWTNFYLSSIQKGIQSAHCVADLLLKYPAGTPEQNMVVTWATYHKTMIVLNGGNCADLRRIYVSLHGLCSNAMGPEDFVVPFCSFNEDDQSLNNALTCVGVIVEQEVIDLVEKLRMNCTLETELLSYPYKSKLILADMIANCSLAN